MSIDYGTGTSSQVTLGVNAMPWYFTGAAANDWWTTEGNWNYTSHPGDSAAEGDIAVFDESVSARNSTNIHAMGPARLKELRVITDGTWRFHNAERDIALSNPTAGAPAQVAKEGDGTVTFDCDLWLNGDTVFGGGGGGRMVVNGSQTACHTSYGPRYGLTGAEGLTLDGAYTLEINNVASYQGPTVVNQGTLLFNAESAERTSSWVAADPATWYSPVQMASVTVNGGATLGGTGILRAPVTVNDGGIIAPGESVGTFSVDSLALAAASEAVFELEDLLAYDELLVEGMLSLDGTLRIELLGGYVPAAGDSFPIISYGSLDPTANRFAAVDGEIPGGQLFFFVDYGSGEGDWVTLNVNTPEPASVVLLGASAAVLGWRRRKRAPRWHRLPACVGKAHYPGSTGFQPVRRRPPIRRCVMHRQAACATGFYGVRRPVAALDGRGAARGWAPPGERRGEGGL